MFIYFLFVCFNCNIYHGKVPVQTAKTQIKLFSKIFFPLLKCDFSFYFSLRSVLLKPHEILIKQSHVLISISLLYPWAHQYISDFKHPIIYRSKELQFTESLFSVLTSEKIFKSNIACNVTSQAHNTVVKQW